MEGRFKILTLLVVLFLSLGLAEASTESLFNDTKIKFGNTGLYFTEVDRIHCFNASHYEQPLSLFDANESQAFNRTLTRRFSEWDDYDGHFYKQGKPWGSVDRFEILDEENNTYYFETDGVWWLLSRKVQNFNISEPEHYKAIDRNFSDNLHRFKGIRWQISWALRTYFSEEKNNTNISYCRLSKDDYHTLMFTTNIVLSDEFSNLGCEYWNTDCNVSKLTNLISSNDNFWSKQSFESHLKQGNNIIFFDKKTIVMDDTNERFEKLGKMIVISESEFYRGLESGPSFFVDKYNSHLRYLKELTALDYNKQKLAEISNDVDDNLLVINEYNEKADELFKTDKSLETKEEELKILSNISYLETSDEYSEIAEIQSQYENFRLIIGLNKDKYYGLIYNDIAAFQLALLKEKIDQTKSKLDFYNEEKKLARDSFRQTAIKLQSERFQTENLNEQKRVMIIPLLFATLFFMITAYLEALNKGIMEKFGIWKIHKNILNLISIISIIIAIVITLIYGFLLFKGTKINEIFFLVYTAVLIGFVIILIVATFNKTEYKRLVFGIKGRK